MKSLLTPLLASPELPDFLDELHRVVALENQRRQRFYDELTEDDKFEFINGQVIMHSPALHRHNIVRHHLATLLRVFVEQHNLGIVCDEKALCVFPRNDYEPDIVFFGPRKARLIGPDTMKYPVPDLIVEILSPSTARFDRGVKMQDYAAHRVAEYWIVDPDRETVERHRARDRHYSKVRAQKTGAIASEAVAGFEIPVRAIFEEKASAAALRKILGASSP